MTSNANIKEIKSSRKDSVLHDHAVVTTAQSQKILDSTTELQDTLSHLALFGLDDFTPVNELTTEISEDLGCTSKFEAFCAEQGIVQP
jgi:hypothetical protein